MPGDPAQLFLNRCRNIGQGRAIARLGQFAPERRGQRHATAIAAGPGQHARRQFIDMRHLVIGGGHIAPPDVIELHIANLRKYALDAFRDARTDAPFPAKGHNQAPACHQAAIRIEAIEVQIALRIG